jgi:hypothetical protein
MRHEIAKGREEIMTGEYVTGQENMRQDEDRK